MENPTKLLMLLLCQSRKDLVEGIATMNNDRKIKFNGPINLHSKSLLLDGQRRFIPVQVYSNFSYRINLPCFYSLADSFQFVGVTHAIFKDKIFYITGM